MKQILIFGADQLPDVADLQLAHAEDKTVANAPVMIDGTAFDVAVVTVTGPPIAMSFGEDALEAYLLESGAVVFVCGAPALPSFRARASSSADSSRIHVDYYLPRRPATQRRQAGFVPAKAEA